MTAAAGTNNIACFHATKGLAAHQRAAVKEPSRIGPNIVAAARIAPSCPTNGSSSRTNGRGEYFDEPRPVEGSPVSRGVTAENLLP